MEPLLVLLLLTGAISAYLLWFCLLAQNLSGPRLWPIVGCLPSLVANPDGFHDFLASNLRKTSSFTFQTCILPLPFVARKQGLVTVTCNPKNLEHILRLRFDNYLKGPAFQAAFHDLLGHGIFNSDGETWLLQRKTAALEFTTRSFRRAMTRWVHRSVKLRLWPILAQVEQDKTSVDMQDLLLRLTFDSICSLTFGKDPETLSPGLPENQFATAFDTATELTLQRFLYPGLLWRLKKMFNLGTEGQLKKSLRIVNSYMTDAITARKLNPSDDLLSRFLKKQDTNGCFLDNSVLHSIALNFILAGRDTSSVALSWFFWLLMQNPRVEDKIIEELATVLKETRGNDTDAWIKEPLSFEELEKLVYLKAALTETLRLYPSVPEESKHVVSDDVFPDGTVVPAGSSITYSIYSVGRMEGIWGADCLEYRPERWLSKDGTWSEQNKEGYKFMAFNAGPRVCLGKELAYLQMKSVASSVLIHHRLELDEGHRVEPKISLTLFMKNGLRVFVHPRNIRPPSVR